jgi:hypothetical protein
MAFLRFENATTWPGPCPHSSSDLIIDLGHIAGLDRSCQPLAYEPSAAIVSATLGAEKAAQILECQPHPQNTFSHKRPMSGRVESCGHLSRRRLSHNPTCDDPLSGTPAACCNANFISRRFARTPTSYP